MTSPTDNSQTGNDDIDLAEPSGARQTSGVWQGLGQSDGVVEGGDPNCGSADGDPSRPYSESHV